MYSWDIGNHFCDMHFPLIYKMLCRINTIFNFSILFASVIIFTYLVFTIDFDSYSCVWKKIVNFQICCTRRNTKIPAP